MSDGNVSTSRQRTTNVRPSDEEQAIGGHDGHTELPPVSEKRSHHSRFSTTDGVSHFLDRFLRKGKKQVGVVDSLRAIVLSSWLNIFLIFIPFAWAAHFEARDGKWPEWLVFALCFLALIPLERLFDYGGTQMTFYCGKDLGDLVVVTLNNAVEACLAIILLKNCELKLLQSTIIGVVILHLLLIPGAAFITGGVRITHQDLNPHITQLNHTMLTIGVMTLLLPAAFFAALDRGVASVATGTADGLVNDTTRDTFLIMSRGLAIILLVVYLASRIFLHNPPGDKNALHPHPHAPEALKCYEHQLSNEDPEVNQWVCITMLVVTITIMAATAVWLVDSVEFVREQSNIKEEWFGLILLPIVSFSADGAVTIAFFARSTLHLFLGRSTPPATLAKARAIDLSIQFTLFWMPFIVLLGWWSNKPMSLLFDFFEVALLLGACFLVNYVTADAKTNWAEGFAMVAFYAMIALCAWFYTGQPEIHKMLACVSIQEASAAAEGVVHK